MHTEIPAQEQQT